MAKQRRHSSSSSQDSRRRSARTARIGETLREVVAEELTRIDDERLSFVTVTRLAVDSELNKGTVYYDSMQGQSGDTDIVQAFNDHRKRLQNVIATQVRMRRTPILEFQPDEAIRAAQRIEEILRQDKARRQEMNE